MLEHKVCMQFVANYADYLITSELRALQLVAAV